MKNTRKIFLYALYTLTAVGFFLYWLFPSKTVSDLIVSRINQVSPVLQVDIKNAYAAFPPGLKFEPVAMAYADLPIMRFDYLKVTPSLLSLLSSQKQFDFSGTLGTGTLKGKAELTSEERPQSKVTFNLDRVPIDLLEFLKMWPNYKVAGDMNAYVDFDSRKGTGGTTNISLDLAPAKIILSTPLMGIEQLEFSQIQTELTITPRMLQIKRCDASGAQLEGKITGSIVFRQPIQSSRLTLSCTLKPQAAFIAEHRNDMLAAMLGSENAQKRGIIFRISGTLDNPSYVIR
ncbi:MAG: type II secretion system protein GspN [Desulfatitalea sp.]|nr:type II secretion system protein GspN [Desulfatitalea sp.]MBI5896825.1 type II secretion system protein GspN [Desulfobacterales bacterium]